MLYYDMIVEHMLCHDVFVNICYRCVYICKVRTMNMCYVMFMLTVCWAMNIYVRLTCYMYYRVPFYTRSLFRQKLVQLNIFDIIFENVHFVHRSITWPFPSSSSHSAASFSPACCRRRRTDCFAKRRALVRYSSNKICLAILDSSNTNNNNNNINNSNV